MKKRLVETTEDRLLVTVLGLLFLVSLLVPLGERITGKEWPAAWSAAVVLAALYSILRLVGTVPEIHSNVQYLRNVADVRVQRLDNVSDFYESLTSAVDKARATLDLTHIRDTPPRDFGTRADVFFDKLVDWCAEDGRSIRRVISARNPAMRAWARQLQEETKHLSRFNVRVTNWSLETPAMNMAIVDGKVVFLALTADAAERTKGIAMEDPTGAQYFTDYYDTLWRTSTPLEEWLAGRQAVEGTER
jgi:hypothetical protein